MKPNDRYVERGSLVKLMTELTDESNLHIEEVRDIDFNDLLKVLTEGQRKMFIKYYVKSNSIESISEEENIPPFNILRQLQRGRKRIIKNLLSNQKATNENDVKGDKTL